MRAVPFSNLVGLVGLTLLLGGCHGFKVGKDGFGFELSSSQIQTELDRRAGFPIEREAGGVATVSVSQAALRLWPEENAIGLSVPVKVRIPFGKWTGTATVSTVPVYEPSEGAIYVSQLKLRKLEIPGMSSNVEGAVSVVVTKILEVAIQRYKVYELDQEKFGEQMARLALKEIKVHPEGVFFRLGF
ncbi:MAG: DUF1439 domain-containing protein [Fibrobacteria bacterium]|nr:DUF1439 domain-containing protein [Fibrobacteria bacterium]